MFGYDNNGNPITFWTSPIPAIIMVLCGIIAICFGVGIFVYDEGGELPQTIKGLWLLLNGSPD